MIALLGFILLVSIIAILIAFVSSCFLKVGFKAANGIKKIKQKDKIYEYNKTLLELKEELKNLKNNRLNKSI